jgi:hypothetical protein
MPTAAAPLAEAGAVDEKQPAMAGNRPAETSRGGLGYAIGTNMAICSPWLGSSPAIFVLSLYSARGAVPDAEWTCWTATSLQTRENALMADKNFLLQRICIYAGKEFDPNVDQQVIDVLRSKFNIHLPQRASLDQSLASARSDHEILRLILEYRSMA